jgi:hypothetical protein
MHLFFFNYLKIIYLGAFFDVTSFLEAWAEILEEISLVFWSK